MDGGRSHTSQEEDKGRRALKQLRVALHVQEKEVVVQPEPQTWLPALMLHGEPSMDDASLSMKRYLGMVRFSTFVATRTLKNSESDLLKAREDLKEVTRARDSVESGRGSDKVHARG